MQFNMFPSILNSFCVSVFRMHVTVLDVVVDQRVRPEAFMILYRLRFLQYNTITLPVNTCKSAHQKHIERLSSNWQYLNRNQFHRQPN